MLSCESLSYVREERVLFHQLGFTLAKGAILHVQGANGIGKTTLLKLLAGIATPSAGEVFYNGVPISEERKVYGQLMQYVGDRLAVKPEWTVRQNIAFWGRCVGIDFLVEASVSYFKLDAIAHLPCYMLSDGWKKRVALARLLVSASECWILDEPLTHLDQEGKELLAQLISVRATEGGSVIFASHEPIGIKEVGCLQMADFVPKEPVC